ncbi:MAG: hypothetical protein JSU87_11035 [Gemmatimonadota bacterium]|nr:MAG: hypothetical protein JSU87_11035 [Gemmatimonadota bacterium]
MNSKQWIVLPALCLLAACGGDAGRDAIVIENIGGVPTVMNPETGLLGDTVPWKLTQYLLVAGDQLYDRRPATYALDVGILPGGGVAVLDAGNRRVLRFDPNGIFLGSFGGLGQEPGQFVTPIYLEVASDRIYVVDRGLNRVTAFDTSGIFLSRFEIDLAGLAGTTPLFESGGSDELYMAAEPVPFLEEVRDTGSAVIYRFDGAGNISDTVATFLPSRWTPIEDAEGKPSFVKVRFAPGPRLSAIPGRVATVFGANYQIELRNPDGSVARRVTRTYANVPVDEAIRDSVLDRLEKSQGSLSREALELIRFAPVVPAVEGLVLDDQGRLWVDPYAPEPTRRDVFDAEGRFLGPLYLPQPVALEDVQGDRACGVIGEVTGESAVACYRIAGG